MKNVARYILRPLSPIIRTVREYRLADFPHDLLAGLTVSVVDLPQSMAFAVIAGVPAVYGLYTAIFLAFFGALFTSSRFLSVGPTNTQSLLIAAIVSRLTTDPAVYLQLVIGLSLVKGLIQLAFAAARLGQLVRFVSESVMVGFTAGAAVLIVAEQIPAFFGMPRSPSSEHAAGLIDVFQRVGPHLSEISGHTAAVGAACLVVLVGARLVSERIPGALLCVAGGAVMVALAGWSDVAIVGALPHGLPAVRLPTLSFAQAESLLPGALAIAILGMLESVAIAKSIGYRTGQSIDADQEFFGQGFANVVGSFFQCIPGSGSFSRTALQYAVGARTRVAGLVCAGANAVIFLAFGPLAKHIPLASLAAILFFVAFKLIDVRAIARILRTSRAEAVVCLVTLGAALFVPLAYAIYLGIFISLASYVRQSSRLHVVHIVPNDADGFSEQPSDTVADSPSDIAMLQLQGDLFFGVADELADQLAELAESGVRVAILRLKRTHSLDATVLFTLERFIENLHAGGGHVILCGVTPELHEILRTFGIEKLVGAENIFETESVIFQSARQAFERAHEITDQEDEASS